jgi:hypothetical protein
MLFRSTVLALFASIAPLLLAAAGCSKDPDIAKRELVQSGDEFFQQKRYGEAVVEYRRALEIDGRFADARY